jgi:hypothetical protein
MCNNQYGSFIFFADGLQLSLFFDLSLNAFLYLVRFYNLGSILILPLELSNRIFVKFGINAKLLQAEYVAIAPSASLRLQLPLEISNPAGNVTLEGSLVLFDKESQLRPLGLARVFLLTAAAHRSELIANQIDNPDEDLNANREDDDDHNCKRDVKLGIVHRGKRDEQDRCGNIPKGVLSHMDQFYQLPLVLHLRLLRIVLLVEPLRSPRDVVDPAQSVKTENDEICRIVKNEGNCCLYGLS